jgi:hypothetical protein
MAWFASFPRLFSPLAVGLRSSFPSVLPFDPEAGSDALEPSSAGQSADFDPVDLSSGGQPIRQGRLSRVPANVLTISCSERLKLLPWRPFDNQNRFDFIAEN